MSLSFPEWFKNAGIKPPQSSSPCSKKKGDCLKVIQIILDGEASEEEQKHFETHIVECLSCFEQFNLDHTIKSALQNKICRKEVPTDLVEIIKLKIDQLA